VHLVAIWDPSGARRKVLQPSGGGTCGVTGEIDDADIDVMSLM